MLKQLKSFPHGRLFGSKSAYNDRNRDSVIVFNANICTKEGKVGHGDIDLAKDIELLRRCAKEHKSDLFVLYESDARFENEESPLIENAVARIGVDGKVTFPTQKRIELRKNTAGIEGLYFIPAPKPTSAEQNAKRRLQRLSYRVEQFEVFKVLPIDIKKWKPLQLKSSGAGSTGHPLDDFWKQLMILAVEKGIAQEELLRHIHVSPKLRQILEQKLAAVVRKAYPYVRPYKVQQTVHWEMFNTGPRSFSALPTWAKTNVIYLMSSPVEKIEHSENA